MEFRDNCWFCNFKNMTDDTTCQDCGADHVPSRPTHKVRSFGQHADTLHCKLHEIWLTLAVDDFRTTPLMAIRVGVQGNRAIIIKDANGIVQQTTRVDQHTQSLLAPPTNDRVTNFLNAAQIILQSDPSPNTGSGFYSVL